MRIATLRDGSRDGQLIVVSRDGSRYLAVSDIAQNLQTAIENWSSIEDSLLRAADDLEAGVLQTASLNPSTCMAPLPRAWQWLDGSAFTSHGDLMAQVFGIDTGSKDRPLMYQGMSDHFLAWNELATFPSMQDGIDFEGEFGVIVDTVPMGTSANQAADHIRLVVQINDWSLRAVAPIEMRTGFGWIQAKPVCSMAPFAVTPSALGDAWNDGRLDLDLEVAWNGEVFGIPNGRAMTFSFPELIAHAARTRNLVAGTVIGSGTVSNETYRDVGSTCIAERRGIEILDTGEPITEYMRHNDRVRMRALDSQGYAYFGEIDQAVAIIDET